MKSLFTLLLVIIGFSAFGQYDIKMKLKNYDGDSLILGNYFADRQLVVDTLIGKKGKFRYKGQDTLSPGVYFLLTTTDKSYVQVFINDMDTNFEAIWDVEKEGVIDFKGSKDNELFNDYLNVLNKARPEANRYKKRLAIADSTGIADKEAELGLDKIDSHIALKQQEFINKLPGSITGRYIKSGIQMDIPEYEGDDAQMKQYLYYKKHYFDNVPLGDPVNLRTPFLHDRIDYYLEKLTVQDPDSINVALDYMLTEMESAPETFKYYLSYFLSKYAKFKIVGFDAVYVHLVDNYYAEGKAPWVNEENMQKMLEQSNNFKSVLIGKIFPDITTYKDDEEKTPVRLHDIKSDYTVVLFWAHDCGHCTKSMPSIVEFYDEFQDKGVTLLSVCTKGGKKTKTCMEAVPEKKMDKFINTFDEFQRYRRAVYIPSTPKIFILDKNKKIILKDIPASELKNVMPKIMESEMNKKIDKK